MIMLIFHWVIPINKEEDIKKYVITFSLMIDVYSYTNNVYGINLTSILIQTLSLTLIQINNKVFFYFKFYILF